MNVSVAEGTYLDGGNEVVADDTQTIDTPWYNVVGVDEEDKTGTHNGATQEDVDPGEDGFFDVLVFHNHNYCIFIRFPCQLKW